MKKFVLPAVAAIAFAGVAQAQTVFDFGFPFQGSGSTNTGHYEGDIAGWVAIGGAGAWSIEYINDWTGHTGTDEWNNLEAHLTIIPGPGALALLGLAGLVGRRRR